ncbi:EamA family transporter [Spirochaetota bacterium]
MTILNRGYSIVPKYDMILLRNIVNGNNIIMWVLFAVVSALFAGLVAILAKIGIRNTDSNLATAIRTLVILFFTWLMVFIVGSQNQIADIDPKTLTALILSGLATGGSWLFYFKALQIGDVNKVVPVDKSSTVLTILLALVFLKEGFTLPKIIALLLIGIGTYLMIERKESTTSKEKGGYKWLVYAIFSAIFASLTSILGKIGIEGIESNLGTAIRTVVVLVMAWAIVLWQGKHKELKNIDKKSWAFILLSGLATGLSWLSYYRALQTGPASVVVPIDKLSIVLTVAFGYFILKEKLKKQSFIGLVLIVSGTLALIFFN